MITIFRLVLSFLFLIIFFNYSFASTTPNKYSEFRNKSIDFLSLLNYRDSLSDALFEITQIANEQGINLKGEKIEDFLRNAISEEILTYDEGKMARDFYYKNIDGNHEYKLNDKNFGDLVLLSLIDGSIRNGRVKFKSAGVPLAISIVIIGCLSILEEGINDKITGQFVLDSYKSEDLIIL